MDPVDRCGELRGRILHLSHFWRSDLPEDRNCDDYSQADRGRGHRHLDFHGGDDSQADRGRGHRHLDFWTGHHDPGFRGRRCQGDDALRHRLQITVQVFMTRISVQQYFLCTDSTFSHRDERQKILLDL